MLSLILKKIKQIKSGPVGYRKAQFFCSSCTRIDFHKWSKILSDCFKVGKIRDAEKLFEEMPEKNVVNWSIMVHEYSKNGFCRKSLEFFCQMRNLSLVPNSFTFVSVLVSVARLGDLVLGQAVHGLVVKLGWESNLIVSTALVDAYAKCGSIFCSYKVFERMSDPGVVSWNAMIAGFCCNELFEEAFQLFNRFRKSGLVPIESTVSSIIQISRAMDYRPLSESIHGLIIKIGLLSVASVNNLVLSMYSNLMDLTAASEIFDGMYCKDIVSWTTMMGLLVSLECAADAVRLFCKMMDTGINYDAITLINIISACGLLGGLKIGTSIYAQAIVNGFASELPVANSMIVMYSRCGDLNSAKSMFYWMTMKSVVSWTSMISGCVENGCPREALDLFRRVRTETNFCIDSTILVSILAAVSGLPALELCQQLHCYALKAGFSYHRSIQNSFISIYCKCGNAELAHNVFEQMGSLCNIVSWNALISGYGINGQGETALSLFYRMRKGGTNPDSTTYSCILSACSHTGLVHDGLVIFSRMIEEGFCLNQKHYGCIADLLVRAGYLSVTSELSEGMSPKIWKALLNGCLLHCNVELAEVAARRLLEQDLIEPGQLVLLSNLYATVGRFKDAETLRLSMETKGLIKNPGFSFLSTNTSHVG
ncbi:hypothetical protein ACH5RR_002445 [Cinchona calisaya]|uniref:Pentatricopeptide repeat-containing protein n=1 Tax=Cinchona calisaya TaxID=153742 RepID=A0ABD3B6K4_9GENT